MPTISQAKTQLDIVIGKQRAHMYKPIQVAEVLYRVRIGEFSLGDMLKPETYRKVSKHWRTTVSIYLNGADSTSTSKFQDNVFDENAIPPQTLHVLAEHNLQNSSVVERYIYRRYGQKHAVIKDLVDLLQKTTPKEFRLEDFLSYFNRRKGMARSIDKAYEIVVYALFDTLVRHAGITVTVAANPQQKEILREFDDFTQAVIGISTEQSSLTFPAQLFRAGVANAADRGLDMWANFGPAIQVKHLSLTVKLAGKITDGLSANRIVIVCVDNEKAPISLLLEQLGMEDKIQAIVTQSDLKGWYERALRGKFAPILGGTLIECLRAKFRNEFPYTGNFNDFWNSRGYGRMEKVDSPFWLD